MDYYPFLYYPVLQNQMQLAQPRKTITNVYYPFRIYDEVFRRISDCFPYVRDYFWISSYGKVYNESSNTLATLSMIPQGYLIASLRYKEEYTKKTGKTGFTIGAHILVCTAFIGPKPGPKYQVNHKDFIRHNNYYGNLEWTTPQENLDYSRSHNRYWNGEEYSSSKFSAEDIHRICKLMESGILDPNTLSNIVFNIPVNPALYSLFQGLRARDSWTQITSQYSIPPLEHRNFIEDSMIHNICRYMEQYPNAMTDRSIGLKDILNFYGIDLSSIDLKLRHKYSSALLQIRNKSAYKSIISQYNI